LDEPPISLPRLRNSVALVVPQQPSERPTDQDLAAARVYFACVRSRRDDGGLPDDQRPSQEEEADALRYLNDVREKIRITRPDPMQEILRRLDRMDQSLERLERGLERVVWAQNLSSLLPNANRLADGERIPFFVVPFRDGSLPTHPPHNLPALQSFAAIEGLNMEQLRAYCGGYQLQAENAVQMKACIKEAIGKY
ncbi:hypothetical protein V1509DRAFT_565268, partial [Lipomyces kononenkoae]